MKLSHECKRKTKKRHCSYGPGGDRQRFIWGGGGESWLKLVGPRLGERLSEARTPEGVDYKLGVLPVE